MKVIYVEVKSALVKSGLPDIDYALNPYAGCQHSCLYCYARLYTRYRDAAENWGEVVYVKKNLLQVLDRETRYMRRGVVGVGTITDPYQPIEEREMLTRQSVELLLRRGFHVSIQTKSSLILRDLGLFQRYKDRVDVGFTITTLDRDKARFIEPHAPEPQQRVQALKLLSSKGIETWIFLGPVIPGINDDAKDLEDLVVLAAETNSKLLVDRLRVRPFMFSTPLKKHAVLALKFNWRKLFEHVEELCRRYKVECFVGLGEDHHGGGSGGAKSPSLDMFMSGTDRPHL